MNKFSSEINNDSKFPILQHHITVQEKIDFYEENDLSGNYMIIYDPFLDKSLNKEEKKIKKAIIRKFDAKNYNNVSDPRLANISAYFFNRKKKFKKNIYKQLITTIFTHDKNSLDDYHKAELVIWDLPSNLNESYLINYLKSYSDKFNKLEFIIDPFYAVPLGIATFGFEGEPEISNKLAKEFIKTVNAEKIKIDGFDLKIALNDNKNMFLKSKIAYAEKKLGLVKSKRDNLEHKQFIEQEKERVKNNNQRLNDNNLMSKINKESLPLTKPLIFNPNTTIVSKKNNNRILPGVFMPNELKKFINSKPYIIIHNKYVSTKRVLIGDIEQFLNKYNWLKVFVNKTGFYVIFNSLKECERCFVNEDGKNFYEYKIHMDMAIPENFNVDDDNSNNDFILTIKESDDLITDSVNIIMNEFQTFFRKDIRERILAPKIYELLNSEKYLTLIESELESKKETNDSSKSLNENFNSNNHLLHNLLPSFKKKKNLDTGFVNKNEKNDVDIDKNENNLKKNIVVDRETFIDKQKSSKIKKLTKSKLCDFDSLTEENSRGYNNLIVINKSKKNLDIDKNNVFLSSGVQIENQKNNDLKLKKNKSIHNQKINTNNSNTNFKKIIDNKIVIDSNNDFIDIIDSSLENKTGAFKSEAYRKYLKKSKLKYIFQFENNNVTRSMTLTKSDLDPNLKVNSNGLVSGLKSNSNSNLNSRLNRAIIRRFTADINANLKSESEMLSINSLKNRKKLVSFAKSSIHSWGLFASEPIIANEMIIEYVGERIRQQIADLRERIYLIKGIGSSYFFRIDEHIVIDATKLGGIARFINHSCSPNCTAKIIKFDGKKRIVIYALRNIEPNEELTYDYKFEREKNSKERIKCLCGGIGCKGFLN